ncbi:hypothetical protein WKH31_18340 [Metabacillus indicus]|uniref:hypothetical protein n=1 Tax=Metabacillus indicus TaxID=246786 RepID=UPI0031707628
MVVLIGENGTLNRRFRLVGGTYRGERNHQQRISFGWWHLSQRMEPSTEDIVWLMVLIGENGTLNRGFRLVGGTYRRERNHQQRISFGWWYLSGSMEPSTEDFIWLVVLIVENGTLNNRFRILDATKKIIHKKHRITPKGDTAFYTISQQQAHSL